MHECDLKEFIHQGIGVLRKMEAEMAKQTAALNSIAASVTPVRLAGLKLHAGAPQAQQRG